MKPCIWFNPGTGWAQAAWFVFYAATVFVGKQVPAAYRAQGLTCAAHDGAVGQSKASGYCHTNANSSHLNIYSTPILLSVIFLLLVWRFTLSLA